MQQYDGSNALQRRFVHGPGIDEPLVQYEGSGTSDRRFLHADERGSIVAVSDASGAMLAINKYDEFGKPQSTNSGRFQYTGQMWLGELGLHYYKARMYAPHLGRFLQTDPIGYAGGANLYAYVGNDPVNLTDPLGLQSAIVVTGYLNPLAHMQVALAELYTRSTTLIDARSAMKAQPAQAKGASSANLKVPNQKDARPAMSVSRVQFTQRQLELHTSQAH